MQEILWRPNNSEQIDGDFVAYCGKEYVGRVYQQGTIHTGLRWKFFCGFPNAPSSGEGGSRRQAMEKLEDLYRFWKLARKAHKLYHADGNNTGIWHAEDQVTRNYYLKLAAQTEATTKPA